MQDWMRSHPKVQQIKSYGFNNPSQIHCAVLTYFDLTEVKLWHNVSIHGNSELQMVTIIGQKTENDQCTCMLPLPASTELSMERITQYFTALAPLINSCSHHVCLEKGCSDTTNTCKVQSRGVMESGGSGVEPGHCYVESGGSGVEPGHCYVESGGSGVEPGHCYVEPGHSDMEPGHCYVESGHCYVESGHCYVESGGSGMEPGHCYVEPGRELTQGDDNESLPKLTLVLVDNDSTLVYYNVYSGIQQPPT